MCTEYFLSIWFDVKNNAKLEVFTRAKGQLESRAVVDNIWTVRKNPNNSAEMQQ